ncbi:MAG: hypothetical protein WC510_04620 [Candidatus Omnitrophota bacterium]
MFRKAWLLVILVGCIVTLQGYAQENEEIVFSGIPAIKISEGGVSRIVEDLKGANASEAECIITKVGDKYLWKTRNNTELFIVKSGAFVSFIATNGSGYVRIIPSDLKEATSLMDETEKKCDYVEHLSIGLRSVTYYGKSK